MQSLDVDLVARLFAEANCFLSGMQVCKNFKNDLPNSCVPSRLSVKLVARYKSLLAETLVRNHGMLPSSFQASAIRELHICFENIDELNLTVQCLQSMTQLQTLELSKSRLCTAGAQLLVEVSPALGKLQKLSFLNSKLEDIAILARMFRNMTQLRHLDMWCPFSGCDHVSLVCSELSASCTQLTFLSIPILNEAIPALSKALHNFSHLESIFIMYRGHTASPNDIVILSNALATRKLKELFLNCFTMSVEGMQILWAASANLSELQLLNLGSGINIQAAFIFADILSNLTMLQQLTLCENATIFGLDDEFSVDDWNSDDDLQAYDASAFRSVVSAFTGLRHLRSLKLSGDCIMCEGALILAQNLSSLGNLQTLDLSRNRIENRGVRAVAAALPALSSLTELNLSCNVVGPMRRRGRRRRGGAGGGGSMASLSPALAGLLRLQKLNLAGCHLRGDCFLLLADALPFLGALHTLCLEWNRGVGQQQLQRLSISLAGLQQLRRVDLLASLTSDFEWQNQLNCAALRAAVPSAKFRFSYDDRFSDGRAGGTGRAPEAQGQPAGQGRRNLRQWPWRRAAKSSRGSGRKRR